MFDYLPSVWLLSIYISLFFVHWQELDKLLYANVWLFFKVFLLRSQNIVYLAYFSICQPECIWTTTIKYPTFSGRLSRLWLLLGVHLTSFPTQANSAILKLRFDTFLPASFCSLAVSSTLHPVYQCLYLVAERYIDR